jgi:NADH pyrophosphatase NudC (nudix superfamily)
MEYRFCPLCGGTLKPDSKQKHLTCPQCNFVHYKNPKPCVGAVIIREGKVLLIRRAHEPYKDYWDFPGGFLECGEYPEEGLKREIAEELGIGIAIKRILGIYPDSYGAGGVSTLNVYYLCKISNGDIKPQTEIAEAKWFFPNELPAKLAFGHVKLVLEDRRKSGGSLELRHSKKDALLKS